MAGAGSAIAAAETGNRRGVALGGEQGIDQRAFASAGDRERAHFGRRFAQMVDMPVAKFIPPQMPRDAGAQPAGAARAAGVNVAAGRQRCRAERRDIQRQWCVEAQQDQVRARRGGQFGGADYARDAGDARNVCFNRSK